MSTIDDLANEIRKQLASKYPRDRVEVRMVEKADGTSLMISVQGPTVLGGVVGVEYPGLPKETSAHPLPYAIVEDRRSWWQRLKAW